MKKVHTARFVQCGKPKETPYGVLRCVYSKDHKGPKCSWAPLDYEKDNKRASSH